MNDDRFRTVDDKLSPLNRVDSFEFVTFIKYYNSFRTSVKMNTKLNNYSTGKIWMNYLTPNTGGRFRQGRTGHLACRPKDQKLSNY